MSLDSSSRVNPDRRRRLPQHELKKCNPASLPGCASGCSLVSVLVTAVIIALAFTGTLQKAVIYFKGEFIGGASANSHHRMMSNALQLVGSLKAYAGTHEGSYPPTLRDLAPDPLDDATLEKLLIQGSAGSDTGEAWIYFPAVTTSSPSSAPLIITVKPDASGKHVVALNDSSVIAVPVQIAEEMIDEGRGL